ncbi:MAG TPA: cupin domain-containing protein [Kineosporiaceae bacterium]|nr:cupin domain-containing protein [Kineosporiaceae bacterium]
MDDDQQPVRLIREADLAAADPTPGMRRRLAFEAPGLWAGTVDTAPGATSGWHHHGGHETSLYVVRGRMRLEFGPGGHDAVEAGPGEFLHVPAGTVHRESNPGDATSTAVIARAGSGAPTVNVDGPPAESAPCAAGGES